MVYFDESFWIQEMQKRAVSKDTASTSETTYTSTDPYEGNYWNLWNKIYQDPEKEQEKRDRENKLRIKMARKCMFTKKGRGSK